LNKPEITKPAAAPPIHGGRDAARVRAVNHFLQTRNDVRVAMLAEFDHQPAAAHLMRDCARRAGTGEGVEHEVAGVSCDFDDMAQKSFGLWKLKFILLTKQRDAFIRSVLSVKTVNNRSWFSLPFLPLFIPKILFVRHCEFSIALRENKTVCGNRLLHSFL
jgi:hypothetical protein